MIRFSVSQHKIYCSDSDIPRKDMRLNKNFSYRANLFHLFVFLNKFTWEVSTFPRLFSVQFSRYGISWDHLKEKFFFWANPILCSSQNKQSNQSFLLRNQSLLWSFNPPRSSLNKPRDYPDCVTIQAAAVCKKKKKRHLVIHSIIQYRESDSFPYPSLLGEEGILMFLTSSGYFGGRLLNHSRVGVQFHQGLHVGERVASDWCTTDHLPAMSNENKNKKHIKTQSRQWLNSTKSYAQIEFIITDCHIPMLWNYNGCFIIKIATHTTTNTWWWDRLEKGWCTYIGRLMTFWISSDFRSRDKSVPVMMGCGRL